MYLLELLKSHISEITFGLGVAAIISRLLVGKKLAGFFGTLCVGALLVAADTAPQWPEQLMLYFITTFVVLGVVMLVFWKPKEKRNTIGGTNK